MKPVFEKVFNQRDSSFNVMRLETQSFDHPYHFHPEYELTLITAGSGNRFVGDHTDRFMPQDLVLLGSNLPHCWMDYGESRHPVSAVVIQFNAHCFGSDFFSLPEMRTVETMMLRSGKGIQFTKTSKPILGLLNDLPRLRGMDQFIAFLSIMNQLSREDHYAVLSTSDYAHAPAGEKFSRIDKVFEYVSGHFRSTLDLPAIAALVHMTPSAFCHYFKKYTRKTFTQYVNEVRIGYACKLLIETDLNVSEIGYQSGYNSLSRFNKCFKLHRGKTPLGYRKNFISLNRM